MVILARPKIIGRFWRTFCTWIPNVYNAQVKRQSSLLGFTQISMERGFHFPVLAIRHSSGAKRTTMHVRN